MLSFLHTPPSSPSEVNPIKYTKSQSPEYIPIKQESWAVSSPESELETRRKRKLERTDLADAGPPMVKLAKTLTDIEEDRYMECKRLFDNPEDVVQAISLLKTRKNVNIKAYSHEGTFIPNVLLALSQTPILSTKGMNRTATTAPTKPTTSLTKPATSLNKPTKPKSECSRPYVCEYCGKQFTNIGNLATHSRTHTKEKPYKCDKCDLTFAHTSNLQRHQLVHTGQRNNKCPHCAKCFSRSDYLKVHERTHTGEKPYACSVAGCSKRFLDSSSLKKHERTHTGDRPFACHICYKTYTESSKLKMHLQTHSLPKNTTCPKKSETPAPPTTVRSKAPALPPISLPFYNPQLPFLYPSYSRLLSYTMRPSASLAKPTPTRPRALYANPYLRPGAAASAPVRAGSLPKTCTNTPRSHSAFLPV